MIKKYQFNKKKNENDFLIKNNIIDLSNFKDDLIYKKDHLCQNK